MLRRFAHRPLADLLVIDDPMQMAALNDHPNVSRHVLDEGGWLTRHYPGLRPALVGLENAFAPWNQIE